jgi:hypothetical protein
MNKLQSMMGRESYEEVPEIFKLALGPIDVNSKLRAKFQKEGGEKFV